MSPRNARKHFKNEELVWFKKNYPIVPIEKCMEKLGRSRKSLNFLAHKHKIRKRKIFDYQLYTQSLNNKYFLYYLGFFWADGYLATTCSIGTCSLIVGEKDSRDLKKILNKVGSFYVKDVIRNGKKFTSFNMRDKNLTQFLLKNEYKTKSFSEPTKILEEIPKELHHFWWRGFFDGDGSVVNPSNLRNSPQISFSGQYKYAWEEVSKIFSKYKFSINYIKSKTGNRSVVTIWRQKEIIHFFNFLYPGFKFEFGLFRKYKKFIYCLKRFINLTIIHSINSDGAIFKKTHYLKEENINYSEFYKRLKNNEIKSLKPKEAFIYVVKNLNHL